MNSMQCNCAAQVQLNQSRFNQKPNPGSSQPCWHCGQSLKTPFILAPLHPCDLLTIKKLCKEIVTDALHTKNQHKFSLFDGGNGFSNRCSGQRNQYGGHPQEMQARGRCNDDGPDGRGDTNRRNYNARRQSRDDCDDIQKRRKKGKGDDDSDDDDSKSKKGKKGKRGKDDSDDDDDRKSKKGKKGKRGKNDTDDDDDRKSRKGKKGKHGKYDSDDDDDRKSRKGKKGKRGKNDSDDDDRKSRKGKKGKHGKYDSDDDDDRKSRKGKKGKRGKDDSDDDYDSKSKKGRKSKGKSKKDDDETALYDKYLIIPAITPNLLSKEKTIIGRLRESYPGDRTYFKPEDIMRVELEVKDFLHTCQYIRQPYMMQSRCCKPCCACYNCS